MGENMDYLDKLVLLICCIAEIYMLYDFFDNFFDIRDRFKKLKTIVVISFVTVMLLFFVNLLGNASLNMVFFPLITWCFVSLLFNIPLVNRILYFIFVIFIFWICELLFGILLEIPFEFMESSSVLNLSDMPWQLLTMKMLTYILFSVSKQIAGKSKRYMPRKIFLMYLCLPIASFCIMLLTYYMGMRYFEYPAIKIIMTFSYTLMLAGNILIFYAFNLYSREIYINMEQKALILQQKMDLSHYVQIARVNEKHEEFIHNISHYLKVIGELSRENKNENINNIIRELNVELESRDFILYSENHILNAILAEKRELIEKKQIKFDAYVEPGVDLGKVSDMDLVTMLENLLDNAITASEKCEEEPRVKVCIFMQNEGGICIIKVKNTFNGEIIKTSRGFLTTKQEKGRHGIGIQSVEKTAKKYGGYLNCSAENNEFTSILVLTVK